MQVIFSDKKPMIYFKWKNKWAVWRTCDVKCWRGRRSERVGGRWGERGGGGGGGRWQSGFQMSLRSFGTNPRPAGRGGDGVRGGSRHGPQPPPNSKIFGQKAALTPSDYNFPSCVLVIFIIFYFEKQPFCPIKKTFRCWIFRPWHWLVGLLYLHFFLRFLRLIYSPIFTAYHMYYSLHIIVFLHYYELYLICQFQ